MRVNRPAAEPAPKPKPEPRKRRPPNPTAAPKRKPYAGPIADDLGAFSAGWTHDPDTGTWCKTEPGVGGRHHYRLSRTRLDPPGYKYSFGHMWKFESTFVFPDPQSAIYSLWLRRRTCRQLGEAC